MTAVITAPFHNRAGQIAVDLPGAHALFTTASWGDVRDRESEIGERLRVSVARPRQVHGAAVIRTAVAHIDATAEADAVVTSTPGIAPMIIAADCVPVVVAGSGAVAAVHAGWRGLRDGVIANAVAAVRAAGSDAPGPGLSAAIGPCAGSCCYEVSDELHELFAERGEDFRAGQNLDLNAIARQQLSDAGVQTIHDLGLCTICSDPGLLFSHRRDGGRTGRQGALIWLT